MDRSPYNGRETKHDNQDESECRRGCVAAPAYLHCPAETFTDYFAPSARISSFGGRALRVAGFTQSDSESRVAGPCVKKSKLFFPALGRVSLRVLLALAITNANEHVTETCIGGKTALTWAARTLVLVKDRFFLPIAPWSGPGVTAW
jgi:hypothetical protein